VNSFRATLFRLLAIATALMLSVTATAAQAACPPACSGQSLTTPNFTEQDLTNANFEGATIIGGAFIRATLIGANFNNATFQSVPGHPTQTPDFTFANLKGATFIGAKFLAPTHFTYAPLTCADFSHTDLSNGNAVFGDEPLIYEHFPHFPPPACRTKFQYTTMNCEFINDWHNFDLTGANVRACLAQLAGRDFSYAIMQQVNLNDAYLAGTDFSYAQLQQATLSRVNLAGANLANAFLSEGNNGAGAATLESAHLKNVNLSNAQLSGVTFTNANFYGTSAANSGGCTITSKGFTVNCSTATGATITGTSFTGAYLYGVDFTSATIKGADFTSAVLTGANFASASIDVNPTNGAATKFIGAHLQGTNLSTTLTSGDMTNAFLDFVAGGNNLFVELSGGVHNVFACGEPSTCQPASGGDVCVVATYGLPTSVPANNPSITCPNGATGNCGAAGAASWKSGLDIGTSGNGPPPGWYPFKDATYTRKAKLTDVCNMQGIDAAVPSW
jgi:uncharacterized protein YjbI with pentapeptide repeats